MIIRTIFLVFLFSIGIILTPCCQNNSFSNLSEALKASKIAKKNLIVFRIKNTKINFTPGHKEQSIGLVDSLIHTTAFREPFKKEYHFYYHDGSMPLTADQLYLSQRFLDEELPHMIVLNDKEECIAFILLSPGIIDKDFFAYTQNKIKEFEPQVKALQDLDLKFKSKNISSSELEELIRNRYLLRKTSISQWNSLASQKEEIPLSNAFRFVAKEAFTKEDAFFTYLMRSEHSDLKIELLQNLKQRALREADTEQYLSLKANCDSIRNLSLYGKSHPPKYTIAPIAAEKKYADEETMKLIELYAGAVDENMLVKTATMFARSLLSNTQKEDKPVLIVGPDENDIFGKLIVTNEEGDTVKTKSAEDHKKMENTALSASELHAVYLSQIAWSFAEVVKNKTNLFEAIVWCKKSIEWRPSKENNHVIAHLYFITGKPQKAIEHQKKAISMALDEGLTQKQIQFYKDALLKFESQ